ncbi:MAG: TonB-dependent receptor [Acidobacteria bacterium]|nr:TonB-dependent receptor [Acidobacteriota bacterium]
MFPRARFLGPVAASLLTLVVVAAAQAQDAASLRGRVVNATSRAPVSGAVVLVEEPNKAAVAGADGRFDIQGLAAGQFHVVINVSGFAPFRTEFTFTAAGVVDAGDLALTPELHYTEVVSVAPTSRNQFETYQPTSVLAGQDLSVQLEGSLGATLSSQPGIAQRSLGPGPSRPVIRGLDGDRVLILEDGARTGDLSSQSGDHGVSVNPAAATKLEVVRGPATLLYGANAIGGLVNVITELIPSRKAEGTSGTAQFDFGTGATDGGAAAEVTTGNGAWALNVGGSARGAGDVRTPEFRVANSQSRSAIGNVGLARTSEKGYLGASYQYDDTRYGIPFVEDGQVELTPRRHSINVRGEARELGGAFTSVRGSFAYRRYRHDEVLAGTPETQFRNDSAEFDVFANHRAVGRLKGTIGGWGMVRAFEAIGDEALSPPVDQTGVAAFAYEELTWPHATLQFGGRFDRASFEPEGGLLPRDFNNVSGSLGLLLRPSDNTTIAASLARSARNPALEELYFFGPHPGNFSFEIGNDQLESEKALGFDLAFRWRLPRFSGEVSYFRNDISDFIFRLPISEEEFHEQYEAAGEAEEEEGGHEHGEFPFIVFTGADALLQGVEAHADLELAQGLNAEVSFDLVRAELKDSGDPLPRIPPARFSGGLRYQRNAFQSGASVTRAARQDRVYGDETETDGYTLLKLFASYSVARGPILHTFTARLDNATNELYRNHLSYIKDEVPEMGRNFKVVYAVKF